MALNQDLEQEVAGIFNANWSTSDGRIVPGPENLRLGNDGTRIKAAVLYADLAQSTWLVDNRADTRAAEVYKAFLTCCARIVKANYGVITAYDGDRIMAVYIGDHKNTNAVKSALKINHAMTQIIRPKYKTQYSQDDYMPGHGVGIDTSDILVARIGVRNDNDLVWVGRAANHAAKLSGLREQGFPTWITHDVYKSMNDSVKYVTGTTTSMWEQRSWAKLPGQMVYRSTYRWTSA